ncbi:Fur family transcriptional regulator [Pseudoflavitalea rhizosphaerae]|uniref:Fur family transcriptional regulator n=1 Tax=Pseudoflavitalea rhizosphaerae TaxID=1884793 RepID=UPI0013DF774F|nr:transcriptional repressor [Pseudoflavitalea rhizosphaerae]
MNTSKQIESQIGHILKHNQLSVTDSRRRILELFLQANGALAHGDIEKKTGEKFDRVTVYRTLQVFMEKGIIHTIPTPDNAVLYALCKDDCTEGHHHDNHVHFVCNNCGNTICLEHVIIPEVKLPKGFQPAEFQMIVSGVCNECH